jgi:hypothetical protein
VCDTLHHLLKMEQTQSSETSAFNTQTPGKYPEDNLSFVKKCFVKTPLKPYMFRSLLYDHPQGSSFILSALPFLRLFASSSCLFGMCLYVVYVCVCVCVRPTYVGHTHTHRQHTDTFRISSWTKQNERRRSNALSTKDVT